MSSCALLNLTVADYSKFLMFAELISCKTRQGGGYNVLTSISDTWQQKIANSGFQGVAEATLTKMEVGGLMKKSKRIILSKRSQRKGMHMIGIGRYKKGVTTNASFQVYSR